MLPPDNFQETPDPVVAHRTSPTNIGLYLLSIASARDFGWIGDLEAVERLEATMATLAALPRYRGHLYNWYDTLDLRPLDPKYVSSVDSGNLAGHLIALAGACRSWTDGSVPDFERVAGVRDAIQLAREAVMDLPGGARPPASARLVAALDQISERVGAGDSGRWPTLDAELERMADAASQVAIDEGDEVSADVSFWTDAVRRGDREPRTRPGGRS